jgi:phosphoribosylaminoimidazolecarboxamide formyltransferase/IMP cyclohydrolase
LLSVYDKEGLVELAQGLSDLGWELVASGNTAAALAGAGIAHLSVADVTGSPEMLGGRVKTLHPKIHGGILADRDEPSHLADLEAQGIEPIDLVVSNLYPFSSDPSIELIDIGGPSMVRGAAKNHAHVGIVTSPRDYPLVLDELRRTGALSDATRRRLARAAFAHTAAYDAAIVAWLDASGPAPVEGGDAAEEALGGVLAPTIHLTLERTGLLRYGENPHQRGARYRTAGAVSSPISTCSTGTPPGGWCTSWRAMPRGRRWPSSSTPIPVGPPSPTAWSLPTSGRSSATCNRPSAGWWPSAGW